MEPSGCYLFEKSYYVNSHEENSDLFSAFPAPFPTVCRLSAFHDATCNRSLRQLDFLQSKSFEIKVFNCTQLRYNHRGHDYYDPIASLVQLSSQKVDHSTSAPLYILTKIFIPDLKRTEKKVNIKKHSFQASSADIDHCSDRFPRIYPKPSPHPTALILHVCHHWALQR